MGNYQTLLEKLGPEISILNRLKIKKIEIELKNLNKSIELDSENTIAYSTKEEIF